MKRMNRPALAIILGAASVFFAGAGISAAAATVRGRVTDASGRPLADVAVTMTNEIRGLNYAAKTDKNGAFALSGVVPAEYRLKFAKDGYETLQGIVSVVGGRDNVFDAALNIVTAKPAAPSWQDKNLRAHDLYVENKFAEALAVYREIQAADPKVAFIHFDIGNCLFHLQDYEGAIQSYREAIRLRPDFGEAYTNLANTYSRIKKFEEGIAFFEGAIRNSSATGPLFYGLGILYLNSGQAGRAVRYLEKFVNFEPKNPLAYNSLAAACAQSGEIARAIATYEKYIGLISDEREIERVRGVIEDLKSRLER
jgi:tetratricopeptide (TPR) repeat protein